MAGDYEFRAFLADMFFDEHIAEQVLTEWVDAEPQNGEAWRRRAWYRQSAGLPGADVDAIVVGGMEMLLGSSALPAATKVFKCALTRAAEPRKLFTDELRIRPVFVQVRTHQLISVLHFPSIDA